MTRRRILAVSLFITLSGFNPLSAQEEERKIFSHGLSLDRDYVYTNGSRFFIKGMSYSPYYPGENPGEYPKKADIKKDLRMMREAHVNTVMLYWIRPEVLYRTCRELGLRVIQGLSLDETDDFQNIRFKKRMMVRIRYLVDFIHSNGFSDVILCYFIGGELDPFSIKASNYKNKKMKPYSSLYFKTGRKLNSAESFLQEMADYLREYEKTTYGRTNIISHINWPYGEHLLNTDFLDMALFDVYSYWPPRVENFPAGGSRTGTAYQGYLEDLKSRYRNTPVLISEFGYSTAPEDDLAAVSEKEQAALLTDRWTDILTAQVPFAGGCVFEWNDEWWKQGKGAEPVSRQEDPRSHEKDDYEEWFGVAGIDGPSFADYRVRMKPAYDSVKGMYSPSFDPEAHALKMQESAVSNTEKTKQRKNK